MSISRNGIIRLAFTIPFLIWSTTVFFNKALPSGITWKIVGSAVAVTIALFFVITSIIYRKKP
jgi:hypothetical protein